MSDLPEMLKRLKYDNRMVNWNLRQNILTEKEYQKHLKSLKDISHLKAEDLPEEESTPQEEQNKEDSNF